MRNWNYRCCKRQRWKWRRVRSLPMRNWNNEKINSFWASVWRFVAYLWGIETRSEVRCSHRHKRGFVAYLWGIETILLWPKNPWGSPVRSLPMRNWNRSDSSIRAIAAEFVAYLWGIETIEPGIWNEKRVGFVAYLWGIETQWYPLWKRDGSSFVAYLWGIETLGGEKISNNRFSGS